MGVPELSVEIISPSSMKRDLETKRQLYEAYGVKEYWIVFPEERALEVLALKDSKYEVLDIIALGGDNPMLQSQVLKGFTIPVEEVFKLA